MDELALRILLILFLAGMFVSARGIQPAKAMNMPLVYIMPDGTVNGTTSIQTSDNVTYVFNADISNQQVLVQRNNTVLDGNGHALSGDGNGNGISLSEGENVTIRNILIKHFYWNVLVNSSSHVVISGNTLVNATTGVLINGTSSSNNVTGNTFINNDDGIQIFGSTNLVSENNITASDFAGIVLGGLNNIASRNSISGGGLLFGQEIGIWLGGSGNLISNNNITQILDYAIRVESSSDATISENNITDNANRGIILWESSDIVIDGNNLENNSIGIVFAENASGVFISNNIVANRHYGIAIVFETSNDTIFHNNFNNPTQVEIDGQFTVAWDNGYPSGGNYWTDYRGGDANHDGIGDSPYTIDSNNRDNYPLMIPVAIPEFASIVLVVFYIVATLAVSIAVRMHSRRRF